MGLVAALATTKVQLRVLGLDTTTDRQRLLVFRLEAFVARPGFDQCAVDRKMVFAQVARRARLLEDCAKELLGDVAVEEALAVLGKHRHVPYDVVHVETNEPAVEHIVIELLHHHPLTANRIEYLQQQRSQEALRRNRWPASERVDFIELARDLAEHDIDHLADWPQRVVRRHALFGRNVAIERYFLNILGPHRPLPQQNRGDLPLLYSPIVPAQSKIGGFFRNLLGVRTLVSARNLRIDTIHHLEDMPVIRLRVSHWTDPDSAVDEIQWFLAQFSTAY